MKLRSVFLALFALIVTAGAALFIWHSTDRTGFIETTCRAGLPNLSRPTVMDAESLGCTVLSPKQTVTGFLYTDFEASYLTIGDNVVMGEHGYENVSAWFSGMGGLEDRGGDSLNKQLEPRRPGLCGGRLAKVTVEGWMTVSPGGYGHLNSAEREFYAWRVISAEAPSEEELWPFQRPDMSGTDPGFDAFCRNRERADYEGL